MYKTLTRWPLPAVLTWAAAWLLFRQLLGQGAALHTALGAATALGVALSLLGNSWWRRVLIAGGVPLSLALSLPSLGVAVAIAIEVQTARSWRAVGLRRPGQNVNTLGASQQRHAGSHSVGGFA